MVIRKYTDFERNVITTQWKYCEAYCTSCSTLCCHPDICIETMDSAFLRLLRKHYHANLQYNNTTGWLTKNGCALSVGRPPVCHEFLCSSVTESFCTSLHNYVIYIITKLVSYVGVRAYGSRHLVEIRQADNLHNINHPRLFNRLSQGIRALDSCNEFLENKALSYSSFRSLVRIRKPRWQTVSPLKTKESGPPRKAGNKKGDLLIADFGMRVPG